MYLSGTQINEVFLFIRSQWLHLKLCLSFMLNLCPNENVFCGFMFWLLIMYFPIILLDVVIFYLLLYLFCLWSFDTMWFCKDTVILQTDPVLLLDVLSLYLILILFQIYCFHCFSQSCIWIFSMLYRAKFQGSIFWLEVNHWQVTEDVVPVWSAEGRLAQVLLCLGVCFTSLNSVKQEWDDDP